MNYDNVVNIDKISFGTDKYIVFIEMYFYKEVYSSTIFCLKININITTSSSGNEADW